MSTSSGAATLTIATTVGSMRGTMREGVVHFARVPYAKPPVGNRRFALPERIEPWSDIRDCTQAGPIPPQFPSRLEKVMGPCRAATSEDCLHLDIWRPEAASKAPVLVFLHGGAFMTGGGSLACYNGETLARESSAIVVNVSYRLGALGFLPVAGIAPPNLGLQDQVAALRFIREIIGSIGGDPDNITLLGQSAGAYSIAVFLANDRLRPLFARGVMLSTPLGLDLPRTDETAPLGEIFLAALGDGPLSRDAVCALPLETLMAAQGALLKATAGGLAQVAPPFVPVIDGDLIAQNPLHALASGVAAGTPILIGTTRDEMLAFYFQDPALDAAAEEILNEALARRQRPEAEALAHRPEAARAPATTLQQLADLEGEALFFAPTRAVAAGHSRAGGEAFAYSFDWPSPTAGIGACHCIELPFLFATFDAMAAAPMIAGADPLERAGLGRIFRAAIAAFARGGAPDGAELGTWSAYGDEGAVMHFDRQTAAHSTRA